jgi:putative ribosome biogenesis GTPase RsgA
VLLISNANFFFDTTSTVKALFAMPSQFEFSVPITGGIPQTFHVATGEVLYLLGANGAGKSSLVARIFHQNQTATKRIAAANLVTA